MKNLWNDHESQPYQTSLLNQRVYTSRLLGREPSLVLHGGGNTSVKVQEKNLFGETEEILYVKGSGWDLATIEAPGFAPVRMQTLLKLAQLEILSDSEMVRIQKSAMTDPQAPAPSVEAILHAIIPFRFVDHTHADAVIAITNTPDGERLIKEVYGKRVLYIPYVMPGFILARKIYEMTRDLDWSQIEGMVLMHHGIFSFSNDAQTSYGRMIELVSQAEDHLRSKNAFFIAAAPSPSNPLTHGDLHALADLRKQVSLQAGHPIIARLQTDPASLGFANLSNVGEIASRGPLTPDHVLHTKRVPLILDHHFGAAELSAALTAYAQEYSAYFKRHAPRDGSLKALDPAPRWAVWPQHGIVVFGAQAKRADIVRDISQHTIQATQWAEHLGGWVALGEKDIFDVEYWELEQAKLKQSSTRPPLQGKVALVTGAASGIGKASMEALRAQGAAVVGLDIHPLVQEIWKGSDAVGIVCDVRNTQALEEAVSKTILSFGGLDIVVANAGWFPASQLIENLDLETWTKVLDINLTSQMVLFRTALPYLKAGLAPAVIVVASKNVPAPGPGAAAYSASKAGLTQLARVLALEAAPHGIRVNTLHPHAVMDTGLWTPEVLTGRAAHYKMTVEEYKRNNLLKVEIRSKDVADLVCAMAGPLFSKTTGAQVAIDGGNDRVI